MSGEVRQDIQLRQSVTYDDTVVPSEANFETSPTSGEADLNNLRSQVNNLLTGQAGNWWDGLVVPSTFEGGTARGVNALNVALHELQRKRILQSTPVRSAAVTGGPGQVVVLGAGQLPSTLTAAVGVTTSLGSVVAGATAFGVAGLDEVSSSDPVRPKNLVKVVDQNTKRSITSSNGRTIFGLLQSESLADGHTIGATTPNRVQISFVECNATADDLILVQAGDLFGVTFDYAYIERCAFADCPEEAFLSQGGSDAPSGGGTLPSPTTVGQVLFSVDGINFTVEDPLTSDEGWLVNDDGVLLVAG